MDHSDIVEFYRSGKTLAQIGEIYGLSRQRIQQITKKLGLSARDGGARVRAVPEPERTRRQAFGLQKSMAKQRGIEWLLTFDEWWEIWAPRWDNRGRRSGQMVMCRNRDKGPYCVGNVRIDTANANHAEYHAMKRSP